MIHNLYPKKKNGGKCFDNGGTDRFSCTCTPQYLGERCEIDRCDFYQCQNNGNCIVTLINDIPTPKCECPGNYGGPTCNLDLCSDIECGKGTCIGGVCQCDQDYVNNGNVCVDICESINCGTGGYCTKGICNCDEGYVNIENVCVDLCEGVDCGNGGTCSGALNPCQESIKF